MPRYTLMTRMCGFCYARQHYSDTPLDAIIRHTIKKPLEILLTVIFVSAIGLILSQALDRQGQQYTSESLKRSLVTFGVARALNGVISVAQGTEIALQPAGVGITFTPGQILDPINDLVERFSWVMLVSSASIGIQKVLLTISAWPWFSGAALLAIIAALLVLWLPRFDHHPVRRIMTRLALLALILRLSVPMIAIGNEGIYQAFLSAQYASATEELRQTAENISRINEQTLDRATTEEESNSLWDAAKQLYKSATDAVDIETKLEQYKTAAANTSEQLVNLIVVFVFQTIILPLLFLAGLYWLAKRLMHTKLT